jgi:lysozyme family protein
MVALMTLDSVIDGILQREGNGKFTNDPKDSGGPTRWGITQATARAYGYLGAMETLPREVAVSIYKSRYWYDVKFDKISELNTVIGIRLMEFGVVAGQATSAKMLQRALNVLNRNGQDFPDLTADGNVGNMTLDALKQYLIRRGSDGIKVLIGMLVAQQSVYLIERAENKPTNEEYEYGWQLNRIMGAL